MKPWLEFPAAGNGKLRIHSPLSYAKKENPENYKKDRRRSFHNSDIIQR